MTPADFAQLTDAYRRLRIALVGDFCLDRYLEIDPALSEISIETGLPVHNVTRVRSQPGGAGTILNNLVSLGIGTIRPFGFHGCEGEGYELRRAIRSLPGIEPSGFIETPERHTFTYCKPLVIRPGLPPEELNRIDTKNWTPTPPGVSHAIAQELIRWAAHVDAVIVLDQVDRRDTGVVTQPILEAIRCIAETHPALPIVADSRRGLAAYPPVVLKMNRQELAATVALSKCPSLDEVGKAASSLARERGKAVIVTLAEEGMIGASRDGSIHHVPSHPVNGPIDIVGAGDAVTANLTAAMAAGATLHNALRMAAAAASIVIHQLGTTGTATTAQIRSHLLPDI